MVVTKDFNHLRGLHFVHLNIRSLWNKFDQFRELLKDSNVDIFGLSESWLNINIDDRLLLIPDYTCIRLDRAWSEDNVNIKKGGGVCCYIKSNINFSDIEIAHLNKSNKDIEMLWITINQPNTKLLYAIYIDLLMETPPYFVIHCMTQ